MSPSESTDYHRVKRALVFIDANRRMHPTLAEVAAAVDLSPHHFSRMFQRWAGVTPKRFLQHLTHQDARAMLKKERSLFDVAQGVGLSGTGRLHDLCLTVEAMTPGEIKRNGEGVDVAWSVYDTPFGQAFFACTPRGLCRLSFVDDDPTEALALLARELPKATIREDKEAVAPYAAKAFGAEEGELRVLLHGSPFQLEVWRALLNIESGAVWSYGDVARHVGKPGAARAVGSAMAANRVAYLIPCHRVIRAIGTPYAYAWGPERKRLMLAREHVRANDVG